MYATRNFQSSNIKHINAHDYFITSFIAIAIPFLLTLRLAILRGTEPDGIPPERPIEPRMACHSFTPSSRLPEYNNFDCPTDICVDSFSTRRSKGMVVIPSEVNTCKKVDENVLPISATGKKSDRSEASVNEINMAVSKCLPALDKILLS